uniref:PRORP domain-containing protein n=2 Tax=Knipowitschia caucasica TaxID=637954 RepID=A0AAV2JE97_KNICA
MVVLADYGAGFYSCVDGVELVVPRLHAEKAPCASTVYVQNVQEPQICAVILSDSVEIPRLQQAPPRPQTQTHGALHCSNPGSTRTGTMDQHHTTLYSPDYSQDFSQDYSPDGKEKPSTEERLDSGIDSIQEQDYAALAAEIRGLRLQTESKQAVTGEAPHWTSQITEDGDTLLHLAIIHEADDYIKQIIEQSKNTDFLDAQNDQRQELQRFKSFVKSKPVFDVVVDGLNVANMNKDRSRHSETLLAVVSELVLQGQTVLVLGRKHMLRPSRTWDKNNMISLQQKAHCFFTENISEDDPFLLYAALHSGNHCRFVSRDLMRDHKACLPDRATKRLFFKWQRGHQLVLSGYIGAGRRVCFQSIPSYDTIVQTSAGSWHIPYDDSEDRSTYEVPQRWMCLSAQR